MYPRFYIGQKVIAVKKSDDPRLWKIGDVFTVVANERCKCGWCVDVGPLPGANYTICYTCKHGFGGPFWLETFFAPYEETFNVDELLEKILEPIKV